MHECTLYSTVCCSAACALLLPPLPPPPPAAAAITATRRCRRGLQLLCNRAAVQGALRCRWGRLGACTAEVAALACMSAAPGPNNPHCVRTATRSKLCKPCWESHWWVAVSGRCACWPACRLAELHPASAGCMPFKILHSLHAVMMASQSFDRERVDITVQWILGGPADVLSASFSILRRGTRGTHQLLWHGWHPEPGREVELDLGIMRDRVTRSIAATAFAWHGMLRAGGGGCRSSWPPVIPGWFSLICVLHAILTHAEAASGPYRTWGRGEEQQPRCLQPSCSRSRHAELWVCRRSASHLRRSGWGGWCRGAAANRLGAVGCLLTACLLPAHV